MASVIACLLLFGVSPPGAQAVEPPPNIVVFYLDDVSPHDGRLWNDPSRTPAIYKHFIERGIDFPNAIGENPLCCPGRANFLTGLHTHNNGVIENDAQLFDPSVHIGKALKDVGYSTMYIGKYLNLNSSLSPDEWQSHGAGWTYLDAIYGVNGAFNNYTLHTKTGNIAFGTYHSTQMVADRTIMHLRDTPATTPVFAVVSIFNLHSPNTPMPEFKDDPRCAAMPPWNPPNYNEQDVSDKPAQVQALPLLPYADGWPMVGYCEEMLGVDKAVRQVTDELEADGRLDNTLLVFTADNGMSWGAHRFGQQKRMPYATPVPLYMSWPARWGSAPRTITDHTTSIDLAPTFCDLAGCVLNGYPAGQTTPDGVSLRPLLDGNVADLGRDALLEVSYLPGHVPWQALRTTALHPLGLWHYVEYGNGERELYDLKADPWELENLAGVSRDGDLMTALGQRLDQLRQEGLTTPRGSVHITQETVPPGSQDFTFSGGLGAFTLDDDTDPTRWEDTTFKNVPVGTYTVTQEPVPGWTLTAIDCDAPSEVNLVSRTATIDLQPNTSLDCTFSNAPATTSRRPDAAIALSEAGPFKGNDVYSSIVIDSQKVKRTGVKRNGVYDYAVTFQNDGGRVDSFTVRGLATGSSKMTVTYLDPANVTTGVTAGTYIINNLAPAAKAKLTVRITVGPTASAGAKLMVDLFVSSINDASRVDVVRAVAVR